MRPLLKETLVGVPYGPCVVQAPDNQLRCNAEETLRDRPFPPHGSAVRVDGAFHRYLVWRADGHVVHLELHDVDGRREGVQLLFPSHLVPSVVAFVEMNSIILLALTSGGTLFRVQFEGPQFFSELAGKTRYSAYPVASPNIAGAMLMHAASPREVVVALENGNLLHLTPGGATLDEKEISAANLFSRFMTAFGLRTTDDSRPVCLKTIETPMELFAFVISLDGKLRVWGINKRQMLGEAESVSSGEATPEDALAVVLDKQDGLDDVGASAIVYVPDSPPSIKVLRFDLSGGNAFRWDESTFPAPSGFSRMDCDGERVWLLCSDSQDAREMHAPSIALHWAPLERLDADGNRWKRAVPFSMQKDDVVPEIRTFLASVSDIATDPVEREKRVADINAMFLGALLVPGRFVVRTLTRALSRFDGQQDGLYASDLSTMIAGTIAASASRRQYQQDHQQNALPYEMALEVEWNRFVDLCLEEDRKRKIPLGIVADPHMGAVLVLRADDISVAREMTAAECLHHIARQDISMSVLLLESRLHSSLRDNQDALQLLLQLFDLLPSVFSDASIHRRISELMDEAAATDGDSTVAQIVYRICEDETLREPLASLAVTLEAEFGSLLDLLLERENFISALFDVLGEFNHAADLGAAALPRPFVTNAAVYAVLQDIIARQTLIRYAGILIAALRLTVADVRPDQELAIGASFSSVLRLHAAVRIAIYLLREGHSKGAQTRQPDIAESMTRLEVATEVDDTYAQTLWRAAGVQVAAGATLTACISDAIAKLQQTLHLPKLFNVTRSRIGNLESGLEDLVASLGQSDLYQAVYGISQITSVRTIKMCPILARAAAQSGEEALALRLALSGALSDTTDQQDLENVVRYFEHMMDVFERERATKALAGISEAALTMLDHEATPLDDFLSAFRRSALSRLFSAALRLSSFEQAQNAMLRMENREWRLDCLRQFVTVACEQKEYGLLTEFAFGELQHDLEALLLFKAESSPLLSEPNYFSILFAYYTYRNNFTDAAHVMYRYARKLMSGADVGSLSPSLLAERTKALLAAAQTLSFARPESRWVNVTSEETTGENMKRHRSGTDTLRSKDPVVRDNEVVSLDNIRTEFAVSYAHLVLLPDFPRVAEHQHTAEEAIAMLVKSHSADSDRLDLAISLARRSLDTLDTARGRRCYETLFSTIVQRCLKLSLSRTPDESGLTADEWWQILRDLIDKHDSAKTHNAGREVAIRAILALPPGSVSLPFWLEEAAC